MLDYKCPNCGRRLGYQGLCWLCAQEKERNDVLAMTPEQRREKTAHLIANIEKVGDYQNPEYDDFWNMLSYLGICPPELQRAALKKNIFDPSQIYYHAPEDVRDELIRLLMETTDAMTASRLMECVAMQGDDTSLKALQTLEENPPEWRENLYVDPSVYAQCGGWTFNKKGERRLLNYDTCYAMVKKHTNEKDSSEQEKKNTKILKKAAVIGRKRPDKCENCGCTMMDMLVLDGHDERLKFLELDGIITASCCPNCVCFTESSFSRFTLDGSSTPMKDTLIIQNVENYCNDEEIEMILDNSWELGENAVPVFYGAHCEDVNTIGGFANWINDWIYVLCPECKKPMKLLAQIQWDTIQESCEGTLYIEICPDCKITSIHHQQT